MRDRFSNRFVQLLDEAESLLRNPIQKHSGFTQSMDSSVHAAGWQEWQIKAKNLLLLVCGERSMQVDEFEKASKALIGATSFTILTRQRAIFRATKDDYDHGLLVSLRTLIQAEVYESELEQASELLRQGYDLPAAVIARTVLEQGLIQLCRSASPPIERQKLEKMNADLVKAGVYNSLEQKRITAIAAVGNAAAHGNRDEFSKGDVERMIPDIEAFLARYL